jgi:hypothetical protein
MDPFLLTFPLDISDKMPEHKAKGDFDAFMDHD